MDKQKMQSFDVIGSNIKKIQQLFPNCVTERKGKDGKTELAIDFEKLQAELSDDIIGEGEERYQFTWPDKRAANRLANTPTTMTLRPCREDSVDFDKTQNIYIEGDNLDVLKVLRETYLGKVKMIYIDPPYNTGNDFVYNDDFAKGKDKFEQTSGFFDEEDNQTVDTMQRNTESNGRFHTDWLNMMYPRLKVARDLLADNGYVCISIDDNEINNMQKLCNEVFGESNFVSNFIIIRSEGGGLAKRAVIGHDYLLVYAKQIDSAIPLGRPKDIRGQIIIKNGEQYWIETDWFREEFGRYGTCYYEDILIWYDTKKKQEIDLGIKNGKYVLIPKNGKHVVGRYRKLAEDTSKFYTVIKHLNKNGVKDLASIGLTKIFDFPKPLSLVKEFILGTTILSKSNNDIILDFFSGSATTAHAVMQLNAEDGGNRKFIMVQLPELTDEKSEAYKAGFKNICEIGEERIRRAGKKIVEDLKSEIDTKERLLDKILNAEPSATVKILPIEEQKEIAKKVYEEKAVPLMKEIDEIKERIEKLDTGFRVFKLDTSNMEDVYYTPQEFDEQKLFTDNVKVGRTNEDLLFQVMLDLGIELSVKIEVKEIAGKTVHIVDENYLVACFDEDVNETTIKEIAKLKPVYFVMRDASAANDNVIDNFEQIFNAYSKETIRRIL